MALLPWQMKLFLLDPLIELETYMQSMPKMEKFCGPMKLEGVSMEACQLAMGACMRVMDIVFLWGLSLTSQVELHYLPSVSKEFMQSMFECINKIETTYYSEKFVFCTTLLIIFKKFQTFSFQLAFNECLTTFHLSFMLAT